MGDPSIKNLIQAAAKDPSLLKQIKTNPEKIAKDFKLSPGQLAVLRSADQVMVLKSVLSGATTYTFTTGSTITAGGIGGIKFKLGPKTKFGDLFPKPNERSE